MKNLFLISRAARREKLQRAMGYSWIVLPFSASPDFVYKLYGIDVQHVLIEGAVMHKLHHYSTSADTRDRLLSYLTHRVNLNSGTITELY